MQMFRVFFLHYKQMRYVRVCVIAHTHMFDFKMAPKNPRSKHMVWCIHNNIKRKNYHYTVLSNEVHKKSA